MRAIDKFILHVVHNWTNELNEAYSEKAMQAFIKKFSEEARKNNKNITNDQLRDYISRFDDIKSSNKIQNKDLDKWDLFDLIKTVNKFGKFNKSQNNNEDRTPDVVFPKPNDPIPEAGEPGYKITIWNGSKEDNCITYGRGEKWCITRGSFGNYRFDASKGYPTFYLAKNSNLSDSDKLSFVAIQVRDVPDENKKYVYTNRQNSPYESAPMSFSNLMSEIPWLNSIPNIKSILEYIDLNPQEKSVHVYKKTPIDISTWEVMTDPADQENYLIARKGQTVLFKDIDQGEFSRDYLPLYPSLAEFIAITPGIMDNILLLKNLEKYSPGDRKSITKNIQQPINTEQLKFRTLPFDVKKLLVVLNKWNLSSNERLYITKDGNTIVKLTFGDTINIDIYKESRYVPSIPLEKETSEYLLDYPELDKIPFNIMIKLVTDNIIDKNLLSTVIKKAKTDKNSAIVVKEINGKEIIVDSNSFASYKIEDGKVKKIPFDDEDVQAVFAAEKENTSFQDSAISAVKTAFDERDDLPSTLDKEAFISIINATPYSKRNAVKHNSDHIILIPDGQSDRSIFIKDKNPYFSPFGTNYIFGNNGNWRQGTSSSSMDEAEYRAYFNWMRNENKVYDSDQLMRAWRSSWSNVESKKAWFRAQPPFSPTDRYAPAIGANDIYYLVNKANPRESFKLSDSGKLVKANIPSSMARQLTGATPDDATPIAAAVRTGRGRPAGVPNAPRAAAPAAAVGGGDINVGELMDETGLEIAFSRLPRADYRRLNVTNGRRENPNGDRGAARRNNQLGGAGSVGRVISVGPSKIYIIRLANQQIIASINIQPGNRNYILFPNAQNNSSISINSPSELMSVLQQRNLAEVRNYMVREYVANNPHHLDEVKSLLKKHIAETKNR